MSGSEAVSPTAHYTGYVWYRNGLSHEALATTQGRVLFDALEPAMLTSRALGGPTLEAYLLARHRAIDARLERALDGGAVSQVIEVAAGLSPRGWRFARRYGPRLTYIEADLPDMAARKRRALAKLGTGGESHRVVELDALRSDGEGSLPALARTLDPGAGLIIITEGLLGYLSTAQVRALWRVLAGSLAGFAGGLYLSDLHLGSVQTPPVRLFRVVLSAFVRGRVTLHFDDAEHAEAALRQAGFAAATVHRAAELTPVASGGGTFAHIIEASTT